MQNPRLISQVFSGFDRCGKILSRIFDDRLLFWTKIVPDSPDTADSVFVANISTAGSLADNPFHGDEFPGSDRPDEPFARHGVIRRLQYVAKSVGGFLSSPSARQTLRFRPAVEQLEGLILPSAAVLDGYIAGEARNVPTFVGPILPSLSSDMVAAVTQALQDAQTSAGLDANLNWGDVLNQLEGLDSGGGNSGSGGGLGPQSLVAGVDAGPITLATFDGSNTGNSGGQPTVDWGDGTSSTSGTVSPDGDFNQVVVSGDHVYASPGNYTITVTLAGRTVSNSVPVVASQAGTSADWSGSNSGSGGEAIPTAVESGSVLVATFAAGGEGGGSGGSGNAYQFANHVYSATVDWGDGASSTGEIIYNQVTGKVEVYGSHTYEQAGNYNITTTIICDGDAFDPISNNVTVEEWDTNEPDNFVSYQNPPQTVFDPPQTPTPPPYSRVLPNTLNQDWLQTIVGVTPPSGAADMPSLSLLNPSNWVHLAANSQYTIQTQNTSNSPLAEAIGAELTYFDNLTINPSQIGTNQFIQGNSFTLFDFGNNNRFVSRSSFQAGGANPVWQNINAANIGIAQIVNTNSSNDGSVITGIWQTQAGNGSASLNIPPNGPATLNLSSGYSGSLFNWGVLYQANLGTTYNFGTGQAQPSFRFSLSKGNSFFRVGTGLSTGGSGTLGRTFSNGVGFQLGFGDVNNP